MRDPSERLANAIEREIMRDKSHDHTLWPIPTPKMVVPVREFVFRCASGAINRQTHHKRS